MTPTTQPIRELVFDALIGVGPLAGDVVRFDDRSDVVTVRVVSGDFLVEAEMHLSALAALGVGTDAPPAPPHRLGAGTQRLTAAKALIRKNDRRLSIERVRPSLMLEP